MPELAQHPNVSHLPRELATELIYPGSLPAEQSRGHLTQGLAPASTPPHQPPLCRSDEVKLPDQQPLPSPCSWKWESNLDLLASKAAIGLENFF
jgi:hypothetical protein